MEVEAIMTNASMSILFTKNRVVTRYNRGFAEMFRYEGDAALGLPGMALYPSRADYEALGAKAYPFLSVGKPFQTEIEMRRADDTRMWAQLIGYVINPEDPTQGTIWVIEDRTEQKRAEESLRNALLENQAILDSAVMGISVVEQGRNLRCNAKMEELFGYAPGEMSPACSPSTPTGGVGQGARRDRARFRGGPVTPPNMNWCAMARLLGAPVGPAVRSGAAARALGLAGGR
jgi:PAS domain-containing protein